LPRLRKTFPFFFNKPPPFGLLSAACVTPSLHVDDPPQSFRPEDRGSRFPLYPVPLLPSAVFTPFLFLATTFLSLMVPVFFELFFATLSVISPKNPWSACFPPPPPRLPNTDPLSYSARPSSELVPSFLYQKLRPFFKLPRARLRSSISFFLLRSLPRFSFPSSIRAFAVLRVFVRLHSHFFLSVVPDQRTASSEFS